VREEPNNRYIPPNPQIKDPYFIQPITQAPIYKNVLEEPNIRYIPPEPQIKDPYLIDDPLCKMINFYLLSNKVDEEPAIKKICETFKFVKEINLNIGFITKDTLKMKINSLNLENPCLVFTISPDYVSRTPEIMESFTQELFEKTGFFFLHFFKYFFYFFSFIFFLCLFLFSFFSSFF